MRRFKYNWFVVFWVFALITVFLLYYRYQIAKDYIGIVEIKSHSLGAQEPGTIRNIYISVGDKVKQGQIVATLDISDLEIEKKQLEAELNNITNLQDAQKDHFSLEFQRMNLQLENEASDLTERLSLLESQRTELSGLNAEIERLQKAEEAGLGHTRDLAELILRRDALASYLREQNKELQLQNQKLKKTNRARQALTNVNSDSIVNSMLLQPMERVEELRRLIEYTEHRKYLRTLFSPCDGYVVEMFARTGDVVQEFIPILSVEEVKPKYVTVYLPEKNRLQPKIGAQVTIISGRSREYNTTGIVSFVHPGFSMTPERLSFRGQLFWARKIQVELNENNALLPGEIVQVRINNGFERSNYLALFAKASKNDSIVDGRTIGNPQLKKMQVEKSLWKKTRFEPSGIVWLPKIRKFLVISDDTGISNSKNDHAPWIFLMDETGNVETSPIILNKVNSVNDLEAIAPAGDGLFYFVSSQNISKRGKRPKSREMLLRVKQDGENFNVENQVAFLSLLCKSYSKEQLKKLGLNFVAKDRRPVLNIEGAAFRDNVLYLGLKEPVGEKGAIIWKLNNPSSVFTKPKLEPDQLSVFGFVQLEHVNGKAASISDLAFDHKGRLFALSTIAGVDEKDQSGGLFRIDRYANSRLESIKIFSFPNRKPEGLCFQNSESLFVVFDEDNKIPFFWSVSTEDL